jgi:hypothetical protein
VIQPQGVETSLAFTGPKVHFLRKTKVLIRYYQKVMES